MGASNYLPPFDADEHARTSAGDAGADEGSRPVTTAGGRADRPNPATGPEVTYADFLGDAVED